MVSIRYFYSLHLVIRYFIGFEKMQLQGAADLLLQFSLHSLLKTLQNEEVNCTLQQLEAGGVLLGMVKGGLFFVFFCAQHPGAKAPKHCR